MKKRPDIVERLARLDPEMAEIFNNCEEKGDAPIPELPRSHLDCKTWQDAWNYCFRRAHLYPDYLVKISGGRTVGVVWRGSEFEDKLVGALKKIADRLGPNEDLELLRLIATRVTPEGVEILKQILPKAKITKHTEEDRVKNPNLAYFVPV